MKCVKCGSIMNHQPFKVIKSSWVKWHKGTIKDTCPKCNYYFSTAILNLQDGHHYTFSMGYDMPVMDVSRWNCRHNISENKTGILSFINNKKQKKLCKKMKI